MSETTRKPVLDTEPAWDVARLFPDQGRWSEDDYLALDTNRPVEFSDGYVEFLPMPTLSHQLMALFLGSSVVKCEAVGFLGIWPGCLPRLSS
jgi:hypothetical protein